MTRSERQLRRRVMMVGFIVTAAVLVVWAADLLRQVEGGLYDIRAQRFQYFTPPPTDRLVHVDIDDTTLDAIGAWPWPRSVMAELIDEMSRAGAKVIALDVLYNQPQDPQWLRLDGRAPGEMPRAESKLPGGPAITLELSDHDQELADAFQRAGNVLMAASLQFRPSRPQTPAMTAAVELLRADPAMTPEALSAGLAKAGVSAAEQNEAVEIFYALRREAVQDRIEADLVAAGTATRPTSRPVWASAVNVEDPVVREVLGRLFPGQALPLASPEYRLVAEAHQKARGLAALDRFSRPLAPNVVAFKPRGELPPLPKLIEAAAYSGFVDYPPLADGTVRSVPVFVEHHGRLFSQMAFRIACAMRDLDPASVSLSQNAVELPATTTADGTTYPALRIALRTVGRTFDSGRRVDFPLLMDIPWFGKSQWEAMYDPTQPNLRKQHLSMAAVYAAVRSREKRERSINGADRAARVFLAALVEAIPEKASVADEYAKRPIAGVDQAADLETIKRLLAEGEEIGATPGADESELSGNDLKIFGAMTVLDAAQRELPALATDLDSARKLLHGLLAGRAAIVGWTSTWQIADTYPTPLHDAAPGVVVHGTIVNALLTGDVWSTAPAWLSGFVALILGVVTTFMIARLSPAWALGAAVLIGVLYIFVNGFVLFDYGNYLLEIAVPLLAVACSWAGGTLTRLVFEGRERARITKRFSSYVDPDIVNYFLEVRDESMLSGQRCETTVVFTDLAGFTTLSEKMGEDVVPLLNDFMGRAVTVIKEHRGVVNKFLGDGILYFFNAPRPNETYVTDAVESILGLDKMMIEFNNDLARQKLPPVKLRAGMTTGRVIAGDAGTPERADYTVIGDLVNLAARLESANKAFGTSNLVTDATVDKCGGRFLFRPIGAITVVGQQTMVRVFETLGYADKATEEQKTLATVTTSVVDAFAAGDAKACLAAVEALEAITGRTKLTKTYRSVSEPYATGQETGAMPSQITLSEK